MEMTSFTGRQHTTFTQARIGGIDNDDKLSMVITSNAMCGIFNGNNRHRKLLTTSWIKPPSNQIKGEVIFVINSK